MRHIIPISGKDSLCVALLLHKENNGIDYELMFNPTGAELPCVFEWLNEVAKYFGKEIHHVGRPLEQIIKEQNYFLPSRGARYCTVRSKIKPMIKFIGDDECNVYFGIRADEERGGFDATSFQNITPKYPLKRYGYKIGDVYKEIESAGLKPPIFFWDKLYQDVKIRLGYDPREILAPHIFDPLFAWRSRANCYFCFNQRQYEIVGLWEHYPALAEKAEWYETQGGEKAYTWSKKPFRWFLENKDDIFKKRSDVVTKLIRQGHQLNLFEGISENELDFLAHTSCGLFCGK